MKTLLILLGLGASAVPPAMALAQEHAELTTPPNGDNQKAEVSQWIGLVKVTIAYHSPRVHFQGRERTGHIWGELIPYGLYDEGFGPSRAAPWRAGANESTTLTVSHDVRLEGTPLKAGVYALFLELAKTGPWTWILSSNPGWGAFQYDPNEVVLRVATTPQDAPFTEFLTYGFDNRLPNSAAAYLQWENKRIPLRIDVPNVNELYAMQMGKDLRAWAGFNYQNWQAAAQFAAANKVDLAEALVWADKAISEPFRNAAHGRADFSTLQTKAAVLTAMGRDADADTVMDRAIQLPWVSRAATPRSATERRRSRAGTLRSSTFHPISRARSRWFERSSAVFQVRSAEADRGSVADWMATRGAGGAVPKTFLIVVIFWLSMTFASFGLSAPRNATVVVTVFVISTLSVAAAVFLIFELDSPFDGIIQISSEPFRYALANLGH